MVISTKSGHIYRVAAYLTLFAAFKFTYNDSVLYLPIYTVSVERFAELNFHSVHDFQEYCNGFSMNIFCTQSLM